MDVWVSLLEDFHQKKASNDEHEGSVCSRRINYIHWSP
jgi:hypothetical protein